MTRTSPTAHHKRSGHVEYTNRRHTTSTLHAFNDGIPQKYLVLLLRPTAHPPRLDRTSLCPVALSMPAFLRLFQHPLLTLHFRTRRSPHQLTAPGRRDNGATHHTPTPPLPIIKDSGLYQDNRYDDENVYWNSIMIEADEHGRTWLAPRHRRSRQGPNPPDTSGATDAGPSQIRREQNKSFVKRDNDDHMASQDHTTRCNNINNRVLEGPNVHDKGHSGNDLIVLVYREQSYSGLPQVPVEQSTRSSELLKPGTKECDDFMDFEYTPRSKIDIAEGKRMHVKLENIFPVPDGLLSIGEEKELPALPAELHQDLPNVAAPKSDSDTSNGLRIGDAQPALSESAHDGARNGDNINGVSKEEHHLTASSAPGFSVNGASHYIPPLLSRHFHDRLESQRSAMPASTKAQRPNTIKLDHDEHTSMMLNRPPSPFSTFPVSPLPSSSSANSKGSSDSTSSSFDSDTHTTASTPAPTLLSMELQYLKPPSHCPAYPPSSAQPSHPPNSPSSPLTLHHSATRHQVCLLTPQTHDPSKNVSTKSSFT